MKFPRIKKHLTKFERTIYSVIIFIILVAILVFSIYASRGQPSREITKIQGYNEKHTVSPTYSLFWQIMISAVLSSIVLTGLFYHRLRLKLKNKRQEYSNNLQPPPDGTAKNENNPAEPVKVSTVTMEQVIKSETDKAPPHKLPRLWRKPLASYAALGEKAFRLDGKILASLKDLDEELQNMNDDVFRKFVNEQKNDFANWIEGVFLEHDLGLEIRASKTREEMRRTLEAFGAA